MLTFVWGSCRVEVRFSCFALLAFCCIFTGMDSGASFFAAAALHEAAHLGAMCGLGAPPERVALSALGCRVELRRSRPLGDGAQAFVSLAGPGVNLLAFLLLSVFGLRSFARANLALALVHSLPVEPLDGGLALRYLLRGLLGAGRAEKISRISSALCVFPLALLGFWVLLRTRYNYSLLALSLYLMLYLVLGKDDAQA